MTRALAVILALAVAALPFSARAQDAGVEAPPGRAVELEQCPAADGQVPDGGCSVPFKGSLVDRERMGAILAKRIAAEMERDAQRLLAQDAAAKQAAAELERDQVKAAKGPSWGVLIGVSATALVLGLVGGVVAALAIQDRAK